jgi:hypothetical protein
MIQKWVLNKIGHLRNESLILVRDPQRMIPPGAQAVDGWAVANNFTALLCSGNLALREMYEQIRGEASAKVILVDRTRDKAKLPLFYPDLEARCSGRARIRITLKDFLVEQTGDERWPNAVNERNLSRLILENLNGTLKAHGQLRDVDPLRFHTTFGAAIPSGVGVLGLGVNDIDTEGVYVWTSGEPANYFNWDPNPNPPFDPQPDGPYDDVIGMVVGFWTSGTWHDFNTVDGDQWPDVEVYPIVELGPIPEPGALVIWGGIGLAAFCVSKVRRHRRGNH